jgi:hypothetical protein
MRYFALLGPAQEIGMHVAEVLLEKVTMTS